MDNTTIRWQEHNNPAHDYEPAKYLYKLIQHCFTWTILTNAFKHSRTRNNLDTTHIALLRTSLNDQLKSNKLLLIQNDRNSYAIQKKFLFQGSFYQFLKIFC